MITYRNVQYVKLHLSWFTCTFKTISQIIFCSGKKSLTPNQNEHQSVKQTIKEKSAKNDALRTKPEKQKRKQAKNLLSVCRNTQK